MHSKLRVYDSSIGNLRLPKSFLVRAYNIKTAAIYLTPENVDGFKTRYELSSPEDVDGQRRAYILHVEKIVTTMLLIPRSRGRFLPGTNLSQEEKYSSPERLAFLFPVSLLSPLSGTIRP
uniref:Uncharacterized protein n=1 Tax=Cacopsylla melanoneura TaxID=428564 RepID=A0A8D8WM69_9HEMI